MKYFFAGCAFWGSGMLALYAVRPSSQSAALSVKTMGPREKLLLSIVLAAVILLCTLPMSLSPIWNGEIPQHRNQYEVMTESILEGRLYMDYGDMDPRLLEMDNPYDYDLRRELGVSFHWDHALYNGRYYMYFGIVPVFLLFLPFRLITGSMLTTYHATQIFTALFIVGVFALFLFLSRKFFSSLSWAVYLSLSAAFSVMSVWYAVDAPAMYCTAITAALCMEIWSFFFFTKAVWDNSGSRQATAFGVLGSLFGALAFGCRPPVALANLLAVPMLISYIKGKRLDRKLLTQIIITALPYAVIGALLMAYNNIRFGNPFEFGQSYQLTFADQSGYVSIFSQFHPTEIVKGLLENFIGFTPPGQTFPYISFSSVFVNFPVCVIAMLLLFRKKTRLFLKEKGLRSFLVLLGCIPVIISVFEIMMSPFLIERYRLDIYWLIGLLSFLSFGIFYQTVAAEKRKRYGFLLSIAAYCIILDAFLLWAVPYDQNFTMRFPEYLDKFQHVLTFGLR